MTEDKYKGFGYGIELPEDFDPLGMKDSQYGEITCDVMKYWIEVDSFDSVEEANTKINELMKADIHSFIKLFKGKFAVQAGAFKTEAMARKHMGSINSKGFNAILHDKEVDREEFL